MVIEVGTKDDVKVEEEVEEGDVRNIQGMSVVEVEVVYTHWYNRI